MVQFLTFILLVAVAAAPGDAQLTLLDGSTVAGTLTSWNGTSVAVTTAEGARDIPRAELLDIRWQREPAAPPSGAMHLELADGTRIAIETFVAGARAATIESLYSDKPLRISANQIRRVELQPPGEASEAMWRQLEGREVAGDILLVSKREGGLLDYLEGVVGDVTAEEVSFDWDGQKVKLKRAKVAAIAYFHPTAARLPEAVAQLTLVDGSTIAVGELELTPKGALAVRTPAGVRLTLPLDRLTRADYSAGKLAYLSDLKPTELKWTPQIAPPAAAKLIAGYGLPRSDASYSGSALTLAWPNEALPTGHEIRTYAKGLALRSRTAATYRLPDGMRRFSATAGIDPATADQGHVVLEIRADARTLWEGEIDGQRPPVHIDVDGGTARRLQLLVDYGRNLDYGDRLHLIEARVTK